uniref:Uncharacterized protein n=1 Tax=Tetradesmus obliquus TaxID=3088 RepID=A0A383WNU1_TETOB|eukprot:jgi/Sobl393_1/660/SZX79130.1
MRHGSNKIAAYATYNTASPDPLRSFVLLFSGVCGDPYQEVSPATNIANFLGPVTTYQSGQIIRANVRLQVNHGGRITFRLCDRRTSLDQGCFNARTLLRADTGRPHWYILTGSFGTPGSAAIDLRLPSGFSCPNGCVLQMEYVTYNSCVEPCAREDCGFYADRRNQITGQAGPLDFCQAGGTHEIFLNCADVVIGGGSGTTPPPGGVCGKCNLPAWQGGCKCDSNCGCLPGTGGAPCDKCNIAQSNGGCKCDSNCACLPGTMMARPRPRNATATSPAPRRTSRRARAGVTRVPAQTAEEAAAAADIAPAADAAQPAGTVDNTAVAAAAATTAPDVTGEVAAAGVAAAAAGAEGVPAAEPGAAAAAGVAAGTEATAVVADPAAAVVTP